MKPRILLLFLVLATTWAPHGFAQQAERLVSPRRFTRVVRPIREFLPRALKYQPLPGATDLHLASLFSSAPEYIPAGKNYVTFSPDVSGAWRPETVTRRIVDAAGRLISQAELSYSTGDTLGKVRMQYDAQGRLQTFSNYNYISSQAREFLREELTYTAEGHVASFLRKEFIHSAIGLDTTFFDRYQYNLDGRGRAVVAFNSSIIIFVRITPRPGQPDLVEKRRAFSAYRDSIFYQNPASRVLAGITSFEPINGVYEPTHRERYILMDTLHTIPRERKEWFHNGSSWLRSREWKTWNLANGRYRGFRAEYNADADTLEDKIGYEWGFDSRLLPMQRPKVYGTLADEPTFFEYDDVVYYRRVNQFIHFGEELQELVQDSLSIDAQGRVLVRASYAVYSGDDTTLATPNEKDIRWVFSDFLPVGVRPSNQPQTLAIAPGPSTQTVLLPALPYGLWQATLVDLQGRSTTLPSPDQSGIIAMPGMATGVYSLHLKDRNGRHLHGRFAWQR